MDCHRTRTALQLMTLCQCEWRVWTQKYRKDVHKLVESNYWTKKLKQFPLAVVFIYWNLHWESLSWFQHHLRKPFCSQDQNYVCLYWHMLASSKTCLVPNLRGVFLISVSECAYCSMHTHKCTHKQTSTCVHLYMHFFWGLAQLCVSSLRVIKY